MGLRVAAHEVLSVSWLLMAGGALLLFPHAGSGAQRGLKLSTMVQKNLSRISLGRLCFSASPVGADIMHSIVHFAVELRSKDDVGSAVALACSAA